MRPFWRFLAMAVRPLDNIVASLVIDVGAVAVPVGLATWLGDNILIFFAAGLAGVMGLFLWAGIRLQGKLDRPLRLAIKDVEFRIYDDLALADDEQGNSITQGVFGIYAEFINRGDDAVSVKWSLRIKGHEIDGKSYDDALRLHLAGKPVRVLLPSLHNPLHLGKAGEQDCNRKGIIGFFPDPDVLRQLGLELNELIVADLVATNRLSESDDSQVFQLPELV